MNNSGFEVKEKYRKTPESCQTENFGSAIFRSFSITSVFHLLYIHMLYMHVVIVLLSTFYIQSTIQ